MSILKFNLKELTISKRENILTIEGIQFTANNENAVSILGDSGMGKTSIFKSLFPKYISIWSSERRFNFACEHSYEHSSGNIHFDADVIKKNKVPLKIGFATQFPYFFNSKSVSENLFAPLKWLKISWTDKEKQNYIRLFKLENLINNEMTILSGGQRQLINIARMLVTSPQIAIIDECFSNMDEEMSETYIEIIKRNFSNCLFLLTSHRKTDVRKFGGKSIRLIKKKRRSGKFFITMD